MNFKTAVREAAPFPLGDRGTATVETLFSAVLLVMLLFTAFELGRAVSIKHSLDVGVYRAARYLSLGTDLDEAREMIWHEVDISGLGHGYTESQVKSHVTFPLGNPASMNFGEEFTVRCELPYQTVIPFMRLTSRQLVVEHRQLVERFP